MFSVQPSGHSLYTRVYGFPGSVWIIHTFVNTRWYFYEFRVSKGAQNESSPISGLIYLKECFMLQSQNIRKTKYEALGFF